jgi:type III secretion system YscD/HrpQ family protein
MARLVAEEGDLSGLILPLEEGDSWIIGRDPEECQLVIQDPLTSRKHLIARRTEQGIQVENLSTTNPIQVNEEEIGNEPRLLRQGDSVKIGNEIFRFYTDMNAHIMNEPPQETPQITSGELENNQAPHTPPTQKNNTEPKKMPTRDTDNFPDEDYDPSTPLAEISFGLTETGRWLLKVVGGPNAGAEFYMQTGHSYILGTDPHSCDIVFHDTSVSRQHARITVSSEDTLEIEDLKSRNGVVISGAHLEGKQLLSPSVICTLGTTSFVVYDREGEMQTIISPLLPSIVKVLQNEEAQKEESRQQPLPEQPQTPLIVEPPPKPHHGHLILLAIITGVFVLAGITTASLFRSEPVKEHATENANELIQKALEAFPAVKFTFNKANGSLLLLGHVASSSDKSQLMYNLQELNFIKSIDDSGIIIDEYVWQEINSVLSKNSAWRGITIHSPAAGQFVLSGYLETRKQAEQLSDYISVNFPYLDLLKKQIVVEEDVLNQINSWLQEHNLTAVTAKMSNGEITLTGKVGTDRTKDLAQVITQIKGIPGVRVVNNYVETRAPEMGVINISDQYDITGQSRLGDKYTVMINGRLLSEGDNLDGMMITSIKPNVILLEKGNSKYRIDYNK